MCKVDKMTLDKKLNQIFSLLLERKFEDRSRVMNSWIHLMYIFEGHMLLCSSTESFAVIYS